MTTAPPDIRTLLDDLAEQSPLLDVGDAALRTAGHRRRRRQVITTTAVALLGVAVVVMPSVITGLARALGPVGPGAGSSSYQPEVTVPIDDLRDLPARLGGPVSMVLSNRGTSAAGGDDLVVTASGEVYRLAGSQWLAPTISPDGRVVVWYDGERHGLASRDLRTGETQQYQPISSQDVTGSTDRPVLPLDDGPPPAWSPDGERVVALVERGLPAEQVAVVIDVKTGEESFVDLPAADLRLGTLGIISLGWAGNDELRAIQVLQGIDSALRAVVAFDLDGEVVDRVQFDLLGPALINTGPLSPSPDGQAVAWFQTSDGLLVTSRKGTQGVQTGFGADGELGFGCAGCDWSVPPVWLDDGEVIVTSISPEKDARLRLRSPLATVKPARSRSSTPLTRRTGSRSPVT